MGDLTEDWTEALRVIDAHVDAREEAVEERWRMWEGGGTEAEVQKAEASAASTRKEMEETIRALIDPRTCP